MDGSNLYHLYICFRGGGQRLVPVAGGPEVQVSVDFGALGGSDETDWSKLDSTTSGV